jgi:sterol desaturase/sphingolipid hydroxylase (fatty acid hydroxylase superfamily)
LPENNYVLKEIFLLILYLIIIIVIISSKLLLLLELTFVIMFAVVEHIRVYEPQS